MIHAHVAIDEFLKGAHVLVGSSEIPNHSFADGPGIARANRVNKDEIGTVEKTVLVGNNLVGSGPRGRGTRRHDTRRSDSTHVQPHARRTGPAVIEESEWSGAEIGNAVHRVGNVEYACVRLLIVPVDQEIARRGGVVDDLAAQRKIMLGDRVFFRWNGS